ncbi:hypothetical protein [Antarctobacter sp.]|uniref:hypothetical protein n=1 Tax=Antarctobacter sp. TaxID=1872577 RepID=UPI002B270667|nr:hypothetical protein [Antarctobacter sp.]
MLTGLKGLFRLTKTAAILWVVVCALGFNLLTLAFAPLANLMLAAAQRLAIQPAVSAVSELAEARESERNATRRAEKLEAERQATKSRSDDLRSQLQAERTRSEQLELDGKKSKARIAQLQTSLDAQERKAGKLGLELAKSKASLDTARTKLQKTSNALLETSTDLTTLRKEPRLPTTALDKIDTVSARIVQRSGVNATRNIASMPLESVPVVGALTIVSVTALEIHDACQTALEMEELRRLANLPEVESSMIRNACAKIPTLGGLADLTLAQCRAHEARVLTELGLQAAAPIAHKCDCLELPNGCPGEEVQTLRVPPPKPELP